MFASGSRQNSADRPDWLAVRNMTALKKHLDAAGVRYTASQSGRSALFCRDPDANTLEFVEVG